MNYKTILVLLFTMVLFGCVSSGMRPTQQSIEESRTYDAQFDKVWSAIIAGIAESNLSINTLERDSGIIAISDETYEARWANEGVRGSVMGMKNQVMQRVASFNILATKAGLKTTRVQVNSSFKMQIRSGNGSQMFPYQYQWQQAYSNGTLEKLILDSVARRIQ